MSENVFCLSGWILLQQRGNTVVDFNRGWREFARGFEDWREETYWMGLEIMHRLTSVKKRVGSCSKYLTRAKSFRLGQITFKTVKNCSIS